MMKELDLLSILDSIRKTNVLCNVFLSRHQQVLMELQPLNQASADKSKICAYPKTEQKPVSDLLQELEDFWNDLQFEYENMVDRKLMGGILLSEESLKSFSRSRTTTDMQNPNYENNMHLSDPPDPERELDNSHIGILPSLKTS